MSGFAEWAAMGGYAAYVWSSFALAAAVVAANVAWPYLALRRLRRDIQAESSE